MGELKITLSIYKGEFFGWEREYARMIGFDIEPKGMRIKVEGFRNPEELLARTEEEAAVDRLYDYVARLSETDPTMDIKIEAEETTKERDEILIGIGKKFHAKSLRSTRKKQRSIQFF